MGRWLAVAGMALVLSGDFDLPGMRCPLGDYQREGRFGKLHQGLAVEPGRNQDFACDFGSPSVLSPHGLAFAHYPAGLSEVCWRQWRNGLTPGLKQKQSSGDFESAEKNFEQHSRKTIKKSRNPAAKIKPEREIRQRCEKPVYKSA